MKQETFKIKNEKVIDDGLYLPIMEEFYSIQGEGYHTGEVAYFIRLGGCDNGCNWCDVKESWDASVFPPICVDDIILRIKKTKTKTVVITGGEPLNYNLTCLTEKLKKENYLIHLETSGSAYPRGNFDWICFSPKKQTFLYDIFYDIANELKVIIETPADFEWAEENLNKIKNKNTHFFLQPEWKNFKIILPEIVAYVKENPIWKISLQSHKFMNIP